jgi:hypothetical protein
MSYRLANARANYLKSLDRWFSDKNSTASVSRADFYSTIQSLLTSSAVPNFLPPLSEGSSNVVTNIYKSIENRVEELQQRLARRAMSQLYDLTKVQTEDGLPTEDAKVWGAYITGLCGLSKGELSEDVRFYSRVEQEIRGEATKWCYWLDTHLSRGSLELGMLSEGEVVWDGEIRRAFTQGREAVMREVVEGGKAVVDGRRGE